jgi:hypothetical protein
MKQVYFILLLCCFSLFAYSTPNSIDSISDFLSEKDCWRIDSLFAEDENNDIQVNGCKIIKQ